ncbi:hypothetical protein ACPZ2A_02470 [Lactiplantibacillus plantarum]|uniref:hypothetical protein n=1 Tax=Lactiplantibacillus plantarum TaxID=1590 RepID=UPI000A6154B4|nr:hypothetical protein [Lactiplantibacillus plantarum]MCW0154431.1 hypothetical protein [Lactiplantibacillus plantarum]QSE54882.1 hypothetical protein JWR92_12130 [Lactiplantibacillus plantarum]QXN29419.1 hypothetical protein KVG01_02460 [Lactiplantibacillus plantarum subsp. plantarum]QXN32386.1 hypothetical protein KVG02_02460 [Lactiplantibacillus plantarum subsp. plantarum]UJS14788.1 hypothetical protein L3C66_02465 [Lactiplantibacillus plantarum subsp. plantarum]
MIREIVDISAFLLILCQLFRVTWARLVKVALETLGVATDLNAIYQLLDGCRKANNNRNWQAKIRQTLQQSDYFDHVTRGVYQLAA